jgi:hypothetical protein
MHGIVINVPINVDQTHHIYHMIMQQYVCFNWYFISNHLIYQEKSPEYGDCYFMRFNQNDIIQKFEY